VPQGGLHGKAWRACNTRIFLATHRRGRALRGGINPLKHREPAACRRQHAANRMSERDSQVKPADAAKAAEKARLAAALRANLQRRKAQARGRSAADSAPGAKDDAKD
jgi:hypothetical protein